MAATLRFQVAATLAGMAIVSGLVFHTSSAAFSGTTDSAGSSFTAGTVSLSDDDSGSALFSLSNLKPGDTATKCIQLTYTGSLASAIKLYGAIGGGTSLGQYLTLTITSGTPGAFASCGAFTGTEVFSGSLASFASSHANWSNGLSDPNWTPSSNGQTRTYKFVATLQDVNAAQGLTATSTSFTWEAQNT